MIYKVYTTNNKQIIGIFAFIVCYIDNTRIKMRFNALYTLLATVLLMN